MRLRLWEVSRVTNIVKADKNRLTVRGVVDGMNYLVQRHGPGWWIEPAPDKPRRVRAVNAKKDLSEHLDALGEAGFSFEPSRKENVPPCRF